MFSAAADAMMPPESVYVLLHRSGSETVGHQGSGHAAKYCSAAKGHEDPSGQATQIARAIRWSKQGTRQDTKSNTKQTRTKHDHRNIVYVCMYVDFYILAVSTWTLTTPVTIWESSCICTALESCEPPEESS